VGEQVHYYVTFEKKSLSMKNWGKGNNASLAMMNSGMLY